MLNYVERYVSGSLHLAIAYLYDVKKVSPDEAVAKFVQLIHIFDDEYFYSLNKLYFGTLRIKSNLILF